MVHAQDQVALGWSSISVELLGMAGGYSLNYEYRSSQWAVRGGVTTWRGEESMVIGVPLSAHWIVDPSGNRSLEFGLGYVPSFGRRTYDRNGTGNAPNNPISYTFDQWPAFQFGYRSQPGPGRFLFRADLTMLNVSDIRKLMGKYPSPELTLWFGASFGYTLRHSVH